MKFLNIVLFILIPILGYAQNCCDKDNLAVICYTPRSEYCTSLSSCPYTLDGEFMSGLNKKLSNPSNFGPLGVSTCDIVLKPMRDINSADDIENLNCDIIIVGNFAPDDNGGYGTTLQSSFLNNVRDWSLRCDDNLAIVFQGESIAWGYDVVDQNVNPNVAGSVSEPNIFNGSFGSLTQFNQGGSFQANFNEQPASGSVVLGVDASGRPTVVLDVLTNDIILADVGIMCNTAGAVTDSPSVINDNDILACNIMALGCEIAGIDEFYQDAFICIGDSYTLADGLVVDIPGVYTVELIGADDCDSTVITNLQFSDPEDFYFEYVGCEDDGFSLQVGPITYDESNPTGQNTIQNQYNCDSTVIVDLIFRPSTFGAFDTIICFDGMVNLEGNVFNGGIDTTITINNTVGCDSIIDVQIVELFFAEISIPNQITIENNQLFQFNNIIPTNYDVSWSPSSGLSCDQCINPAIINLENIPVYTVTVVSPDGCASVHEISVNYICRPYVPNVFNPKSPISGNEIFGPLTPCQLQSYSIEIFDRWGNLVFESKDPNQFWDGRLRNEFVSAGVYVYVLRYSNSGKGEQETGSITVMF